MKTPIILTMLLIITFLSSNSQSISISKENSSDPSNVCHNSTYKYVTAISDWQTGYSVAWIKTNADVLSQSTSEADVKWIAGSESDGYIGTLKAQIMDSNEKVVATSNTITVTIKSIKHIQPEIAGYHGGVLTIDPCNPGLRDLESTQIVVPGTGSINPEKVFNFKWTIPKGWTLNGQTSDGSTELGGDQAVTVYYLAHRDIPRQAQAGSDYKSDPH
ncbi:MAG: hypothetical protein AB7U05_08345 [Mangrovibacterium sp.]